MSDMSDDFREHCLSLKTTLRGGPGDHLTKALPGIYAVDALSLFVY